MRNRTRILKKKKMESLGKNKTYIPEEEEA
jgi:hypothetical protein